MLQCGTNDVSQDISAVDIRNKILEVAVSCESDTNILVSGNVNDKLNIKATQVNIHLKNECDKRNTFFYRQLERKS